MINPRKQANNKKNRQTKKAPKISFAIALSPGCFQKPVSKEEEHLDFTHTVSVEKGWEGCLQVSYPPRFPPPCDLAVLCRPAAVRADSPSAQ